jgi:hypothetical protein
MRIVFQFLILGLIVSGCSARWHIQRAEQKCPDCFKSDVVVQYKDSIIYRDTTIELSINDFLELDTTPVIRYEKQYIDRKVIITPAFDTIIKEDRGLTAYIWMKQGRLKARFIIDSTLIYNYRDSITVLNKIIERTNTVKIENKLEFKDYFFISSFILSLLVILSILIKRR